MNRMHLETRAFFLQEFSANLERKDCFFRRLGPWNDGRLWLVDGKCGTFGAQKSHGKAAKVTQSERKCGTFEGQKCHTCNSKFIIYNCSNAKSVGTQRRTRMSAWRRYFRPRAVFCAPTRFWRWILLLKFSNLRWGGGEMGRWGVWEFRSLGVWTIVLRSLTYIIHGI